MISLRKLLPLLLVFNVALAVAPQVQLAGAQQSFRELDNEGPDEPDIETSGSPSIENTVEDIMFRVIMLMGIAAVFVIVIVGIGLIIGIGSEESRARAIKVILWVAAGIIVIGLATAFVKLIIDALFR